MLNVRKFIIDNSVFIFVATLALIGLLVIGIRYASAPDGPGPIEIKIDLPENQRFAGAKMEFYAEGLADSYQWDFEDGTSKSGQTITYIFENEGDYIVFFTPNNNPAYKQEIALKVLPKPAVSEEITAHIVKKKPVIEGPSTVTVGQEVLFTETSGTGTNWRWDFGDGNDYTGEKIRYKFKTLGRRTIQVFVNGDNENYGELKVRVNPSPEKEDIKPVKKPIGGGTGGGQAEKPLPVPTQKPRITELELMGLMERYATRKAEQVDFFPYFNPNGGFAINSDIMVDGDEVQFDSFIRGKRLEGRAGMKKVILKFDNEGYIKSISIKTK